MFGSQALEVAIGLALTFFVVALATSALVETWARLTKKRSKDLARVIDSIVADPNEVLKIYDTSVFAALRAASGNQHPSYVSAKDFADATVEAMVAASAGGNPYTNLQEPLKGRIEAIVAEVGPDLTAVKAGLETWFDSAMDRLEGAYKRWATQWLFMVGLVVTIVLNASAYQIADQLWNDPAIRSAVVEAADRVVAEGDEETTLAEFEATVGDFESLQIPMGWDADARAVWSGASTDSDGEHVGAVLAVIAGWFGTAIFVMLGAPFWFDLLTKLVSLRASGAKPPRADADEASATTAVRVEAGRMTASSAPAAGIAAGTGAGVAGSADLPDPRRSGAIITSLVDNLDG